MATCTVSSILQHAAGLSGLSPMQLELAKVVLLCRLLQANDPMASCDVQGLLADAECFSCLYPYQLALVQTQLLCEILQSGGAGGSSCLLCGSSDPTEEPICDCALYYNRATSSFWYWDANLSIWANLIAA